MFPNGNKVKTGEFRLLSPVELVEELQKNKFTGYLAFTVKTEEGIQDYSVALSSGKIAGAFFENFKTKEKLTGDAAMKKAGAAPAKGAYDIVKLTEQQVQLAISINPQAQVTIAEKQEAKPRETNEDILNKYGLSSLAET